MREESQNCIFNYFFLSEPRALQLRRTSFLFLVQLWDDEEEKENNFVKQQFSTSKEKLRKTISS